MNLRNWHKLYACSKAIVAIIVVLLLFSCERNKIPRNVKSVLKISGENRGELEKVLEKYSSSETDKLKYEAACYLISNIPGHYGIYHTDSGSNDAKFENIEYDLVNKIDPRIEKDTLGNEKTKIYESNTSIKYDIDVITADFLISTIENSFYAWENYPWTKQLSFEEFKKYILPYRVDKEPLSDLRSHFHERFSWLIDTMDNSTDMQKAFSHIYATLKIKYYVYGDLKYVYETIDRYGGSCYTECLFVNTIMKSMGITCNFDYVPHWENRGSNHTWISFPVSETVSLVNN